MKKISVILSLLLVPILVKADSLCSDEEIIKLQEAAKAIKVNYVEKEAVLDPANYYSSPYLEEGEEHIIYYSYFDIEVMNLTKDFYIVATNTSNNETRTITYNDVQEGKYIYKWDDLSKVSTVTFKIYTSKETSCADEGVKDLYLTIPRLNEYSSYDACVGNENLEICSKYVTFNEIPIEKFQEKMEAVRLKTSDKKDSDKVFSEKGFLSNIISFITNNNYIFYIIGGIAIIGGLIAVVIRRKRREI